MAFHAQLMKAMLLSNQSGKSRMLYCDRDDPLNVSMGRRGSWMSNDTLIFIDLNADTLH